MSFNFHNLTNFLFENLNIPSTGGGNLSNLHWSSTL